MKVDDTQIKIIKDIAKKNLRVFSVMERRDRSYAFLCDDFSEIILRCEEVLNGNSET